MGYLKNLRQAYCLKQSDLAELLNISRPYYALVEQEKRRPDVTQIQSLEHLLKYHHKAVNEPDEKLLKTLDERINAEVYRSLIKHALALEEEIEKLKETQLILYDRHALLKARLLALQMLQHNQENYSWFKDEKVAWLNIQLREAQKDFVQSKLSEIHLIDIRIKGLYTQLDHTRFLLQSGKPS